MNGLMRFIRKVKMRVKVVEIFLGEGVVGKIVKLVSVEINRRYGGGLRILEK